MGDVCGGRGVLPRHGRRRSIGGQLRRALSSPSVLKMALAIGAWCCVVLAQPGGAVAAQPAGAAAAASAHRLGYALRPSKTLPYTPCPPGGHMIECNILIDPPSVKTPAGYRLPGGGPLLEGGGELGGYDPTDLQSAYKIPSTGGSGETVALIEAYGYKEAEADLAKYREKYGLAACTKASGCFKRVNEKGEEKNYPPEGEVLEADWQVETALDMDMVSAACASCHILIVEATTQEPKDTAASVEEAATLKATEISNSYGYIENDEQECPAEKGCSEYLPAYKQSVPVIASAGDFSYDNSSGAPSWPATSPNVIAVGGTNLNKASGSRGWREMAWIGTGSGCSLFEAKPTWQLDSGCAKRTDDDVSAVAAPETPVSIYSTATSGWANVGGTSVAAPLVAAIEAHAESAVKTAGAEAFYKHPGMLLDITSGFNGICTPHEYLCHAIPGYDGPTGWGTPNGVPHLSGWFTRPVPNLAEQALSKHVVLTGVSCVSTEACTAVGHYLGSFGEQVFAEHWNGSAWEQMEMPTPGGAKSSTLTGVSCRKGLFGEECVAVGHYVTLAGAEVALGEELNWEGTRRWEVSSVDLPKEAKSSSLLGVSCGEFYCMATGHYVNSSGTEAMLAEEVHGNWVMTETVNPEGVKSSSLAGVSCVVIFKSTLCMAVGNYVNGAGTEVTLAELWNGTNWVLEAIASPEGKSAGLAGVSCSSIVCYGVGHYVNAAGKELTLIENFTGEKWVIQESPNPAEAKSASLAGVSCTAGEACTAVGKYVNSGGTEVTLGEVLTSAAKKWAVQEPPNPTGAKSASLAGVACTAAEACTATGHYLSSASTEQALAEVFTSTAKKWALQAPFNPKEAGGSLPGVSCPATETCTAVGHQLNGSNAEVTLAEHWNGKEWSLQESPNPTGAKSSSLLGVSCTAAEACTAVGHFVNSAGTEVTLAEVFTSATKKWAVEEPPNPTGAKSSSLLGVSCTAAEACTAVGHFVNSAGTEVTLAEVFTSATKKWAVEEPPNPTGAKSSSLLGVSCTAAEACTAVGHFVNSAGTEVTLAEVFTSATKKWSLQEPPSPAEAKGAALAGVSCTAAEACTAVGHYINSAGTEVTLAEVFTSAAKKWAVQESPNPTGAKSSSLLGVSCTAAEECTAVGHYVNSAGAEVTLAEVFTSAAKKWATQEAANTEATSNSLVGVSCKTATKCIAAGHTVNSTSTEAALVEEHA